MKNAAYKKIRVAMAAIVLVMGGLAAGAQNSLPAPGSGGAFTPNAGPANGIGWNPGPAGPAGWGPGMNPAWNPGPQPVWNSGFNGSINQGITRVIACGYDATGVWRVLPLTVSYQYNGIQYDVNVINAWNPWTDMWDRGVDQPAYNTNYYLRGVTYDFYTVLATGTFYFNL